MAKKNTGTITTWAFWLGAILSIVVGIGAAANATFATAAWVAVVLVILGLIVGFANITAKETTGFLIAALALVAIGGSGLNTLDSVIPRLGTLVGSAVQAFAFFVGGAAIVVAVKQAWDLASSK